MKRILPIIAVVVIVAAAAAYFLLGSEPEQSAAVSTTPAATATEDTQSSTIPDTGAATQTADAGDVELAPDYILGDPNAPVTVIEYGSFTCPHCANWHQNSFEQLKTNYIDTGNVQFIFREVYFDRFGLWAGLVARCSGGMRYYAISDVLYETQNEWIGSGQPDEILENLRGIGRQAGLNNDQINACLENEELAGSMVAAYQTHADEDGINATPTFLINGEKYSNMTWADFSAILDEELGQ